MNIVLTFLPVFIYAAILLWMDIFKLVKYVNIIKTILAGIILAIFAYFANDFTKGLINISAIESYLNIQRFDIKILIPFIEEIFKFSIIVFLIIRNKAGFVIDTLIYGFSAGMGFAIAENVFYLSILSDDFLLIYVVRGFGTSIMHSSTIAFSGALLFYLIRIKQYPTYLSISISFLSSFIIHSAFNFFFLPALVQTTILFLLISFAIAIIFQYNENSIKHWMESEFDAEIDILKMIKEGNFSETKTGQYILNIKDRFSPFVVVDMISFIRINLELSMKYKSNMMFESAGLKLPCDKETKSKIDEYYALKKLIGRTGLAALAPVLPLSKKDLWKVEQLEKRI